MHECLGLGQGRSARDGPAAVRLVTLACLADGLMPFRYGLGNCSLSSQPSAQSPSPTWPNSPSHGPQSIAHRAEHSWKLAELDQYPFQSLG